MRPIYIFLITYASTVFLTVIALTFLSVDRIDIYAVMFAIEFFIVSEVTAPFRPRESRRKNIIAALLITIFTGIILERILEILR